MAHGKKLPQGNLSDVAPTILGIMGINKPSIMTGRNLLNLK
jgi:bisphosphoglycerate-independent phosphoglycerate mutase (AlkP superfamily)